MNLEISISISIPIAFNSANKLNIFVFHFLKKITYLEHIYILFNIYCK